MKLMELESRLNGGGSMVSPPASFPTPSSTSDSLGLPLPTYNQPPPQDYAGQGVHNKFPAIAVLDSETFMNGGYVGILHRCGKSAEMMP